MLDSILEDANLSPDACAGLLGVDRGTFGRWARGELPIPHSFGRMLATMLGVKQSAFERTARPLPEGDRTPAIWFKLRDRRLVDRDREYVALVRQLAYYVDQLEQASNYPSRVWESVFASIRNANDGQAPPREQGRQAARAFRSDRGLAQGATGIGEVLRGHLRTMGVLVVETPLRKSKLEGCSFYVRPAAADERLATERPCIFANTHSNTWFRRNAVLCHELGHAIFDAPTAGASLDFQDGDRDPDDVSEQRAEAFAQEMLVPREVLRNLGTRLAVRWDDVRASDMAGLVAATHAEQRLIVNAAIDAGFLDRADGERSRSLEIGDELRRLSERALMSFEYFRRHPDKKDWTEKRTTTLPSVPLRLPVGYVKAVVDAVGSGIVSWSKGAELLMIDRQTYLQRFGDQLPPE